MPYRKAVPISEARGGYLVVNCEWNGIKNLVAPDSAQEADVTIEMDVTSTEKIVIRSHRNWQVPTPTTGTPSQDGDVLHLDSRGEIEAFQAAATIVGETHKLHFAFYEYVGKP